MLHILLKELHILLAIKLYAFPAILPYSYYSFSRVGPALKMIKKLANVYDHSIKVS